jgi:hypothetical protein
MCGAHGTTRCPHGTADCGTGNATFNRLLDSSASDQAADYARHASHNTTASRTLSGCIVIRRWAMTCGLRFG